MAEPQSPDTQQEQGALKRQGGETPAARGEQQARPPQRISFPVDVYDNDNEYLIVADMPGLGPDAFDLVVRGDRLELRGNRMVGDQQILYERSFALPHNADTKEVNATYREGVVRIVVAKTQESRPRKIPVHA